MPAAYAHITLVNILRETHRLQAIPGFPPEAITAVLDYSKFCELGAVSPDYPYLAIGDANAAKWADLMHYEKTVEKIREGVRGLQAWHGEAQRKGLAWLLGYASHAAADVAIHPVINLKVGPYEKNKTAHRICEMHQDVYIYSRLNLGASGCRSTCVPESGPVMIPTTQSGSTGTSRACGALCSERPTRRSTRKTLRTRACWRQRFQLVVDKVAEEGGRLFPFARHVAAGLGLTYPAQEEVDAQFIRGLRTPRGTSDYDAVFDLAVEQVGRVWQWIAQAVLRGDETTLAEVGEWNLDTGRNEAGQLVFWG
ncbi:MAG: zinc dependent phospholipase C family protein [Candidatus Methylomirabilis sp.]|nr:zinc dependent phospholipase C family protein [Candidatus Methylomirabilis sp.]